MQRTQLNINIDPELLRKVKDSAKMSGKSLASYVAESLASKIDDVSFQSINSRFSEIENKLQSLENNLQSLIFDTQKTTAFTPQEAKKCNQFIKAIFEKERVKKKYKSTKDAWDDLISHINCFDQWNEIYTFRLKESLFIEHAEPLTSDEMNLLTKGKRCPCPIRTGLINWINNSDQGKCCCADKSFPSQQIICEKGSKLIDELYGNKS